MLVPEAPIPAPSGKWTGIPDYIKHAIQIAGGNGRSLAKAVGLTTGSRVSHWRAGLGVPSELMALRLAKFTGDDPIDVLTMAGHGELVKALQDVWPREVPPEAAHLHKLDAAFSLTKAIEALEFARKAVER
jgi:hypothetical protein